MKNVDPKKYNLHSRINLKKTEKNIFIVIDRKARVIMKDGLRIFEIVKQIRKFEPDKKTSVLSSAPVCSKTQKFLAQRQIEIKSM